MGTFFDWYCKYTPIGGARTTEMGDWLLPSSSEDGTTVRTIQGRACYVLDKRVGTVTPNGTCRPGVKGMQVPACVQLIWRASSCKLLKDRTEDSCRKSFPIRQGRPKHCTKLDRNTIHNHIPIPPSRIAFYSLLSVKIIISIKLH